jgi:hypothetical protein
MDCTFLLSQGSTKNWLVIAGISMGCRWCFFAAQPSGSLLFSLRKNGPMGTQRTIVVYVMQNSYVD